jgi:SAM-dependent methyltransferase
MASDLRLGQKLRFVVDSLDWRELRARVGGCPLCGPTLFLKLQRDQLGTRCVRCGASPIAMGIAAVVRERFGDLSQSRVYEASSRGPLFDFLRREARELVYSDFFDDVQPGQERGGVRCEDLQALTFDDESFDLCTSTEVFEHVPDDRRGFRELHRVLRPGGQLIFTVPLSDSEETLERALVEEGGLRHIHPPSYHDDLIRGRGKVLVFRDYGRDIVQRLRAAGFTLAEIVDAGDPSGMGHRAQVVTARKSSTSPHPSCT